MVCPIAFGHSLGLSKNTVMEIVRRVACCSPRSQAVIPAAADGIAAAQKLVRIVP